MNKMLLTTMSKVICYSFVKVPQRNGMLGVGCKIYCCEIKHFRIINDYFEQGFNFRSR
jgi:hypothetical protein